MKKLTGFICNTVAVCLLSGGPSFAHLIDDNDYITKEINGLRAALDDDGTDQRSYRKGAYECTDFARDAMRGLWHSNGIETTATTLSYTRVTKDNSGNNVEKKENHAVIETTLTKTDGKPATVVIEPQNDKIYTDRNNALVGLKAATPSTVKDINETGRFAPISVRIGGGPTVIPDKGKVTIRVRVSGENVANQPVKIKVTPAVGAPTEKTVTTDKRGIGTVQFDKSEAGQSGQSFKVEAEVDGGPMAPEAKDKKTIRIGFDLSCVPSTPDARHGDVYVSSTGEYTRTKLAVYNFTQVPKEVFPFAESPTNCDGSPIIEIAVEPEFAFLAPGECAIIEALIRFNPDSVPQDPEWWSGQTVFVPLGGLILDQFDTLFVTVTVPTDIPTLNRRGILVLLGGITLILLQFLRRRRQKPTEF